MKTNLLPVNSPARQRGVTLFIGLMFLLLLTLLGLTSSNVAVMQERMAGNMAQDNEAFQISETVLRAVESRIFNGICLGGGSGGLGTIPDMDSLAIDDNDCTLSGLGIPSTAWETAPPEVNVPGGEGWARYYLARLPRRPRCHAMRSQLIGGSEINDESFIILASGRSVSGQSEAILQSIYTCQQ